MKKRALVKREFVAVGIGILMGLTINSASIFASPAADTWTWAVEPTIEADDIYYLSDDNIEEYSENESGGQVMSPYAVIKRGDSYGLIQLDGELNAEMEYQKITEFCSWYLLERFEPIYSEEMQQDWSIFTVNPDTGEMKAMPIWGVEEGIGTYYWKDGVQYARGMDA